MEQNDYRYALSDFDHLLPIRLPTYKPYHRKLIRSSHKRLNPDVIQAVADELAGRYDGYSKRNG